MEGFDQKSIRAFFGKFRGYSCNHPLFNRHRRGNCFGIPRNTGLGDGSDNCAVRVGAIWDFAFYYRIYYYRIRRKTVETAQG